MARLFIDCDDTLVLWLGEDGEVDGGPNPYGGGKEKWEPNRALIAAIESSREEYEEVVVWTGGGSDYARVWRDRLLPWAHHAIAKDTRIPGSEDVCVDDAVLRVAAALLTPQEFIEESRPAPDTEAR